jgi:N-methylhydantoinase A/oxoprolinase/acetone carboxylase beta subunit
VSRTQGSPTPVDVYEGNALHPGHCFEGPCLVDRSDTTVWVPAGTTASVDVHGTIVLEIGR